MAFYSITVKKNNKQYNISCDDKFFITEHIDMLFSSLKTIQTPVIENNSDDFKEYVLKFNPQSSTDYLIATAKYLLEQENCQTFQLKQLNSKLFNDFKMMLDRNTIQEAVNMCYLEVITNENTDNITEYKLTQSGMEYGYVC